jgi:LPXTG-motif cell wall-anchored protein
MKNEASGANSTATLFFLIAAALGVYGLQNNLFLVGGAVLFAGAGLMQYKRQRVGGFVAAAFGIVFSAVVLSYGIGKDMALRDNALSKQSASAQSGAG